MSNYRPILRRMPNGNLLLKASDRANLVAVSVQKQKTNKNFGKQMSKEEVESEAKGRLKANGQDPDNEMAVLSLSTLQFGRYRGKTFVWLLTNDMGWAVMVMSDHMRSRREKTFDTPDAQWDNKEALWRYCSAFGEVISLIKVRSRVARLKAEAALQNKDPEGVELVGFGNHKEMTRQELFDSQESVHKSYVKSIINCPVMHPGSQLDRLKKFLIKMTAEQEDNISLLQATEILEASQNSTLTSSQPQISAPSSQLPVSTSSCSQQSSNTPLPEGWRTTLPPADHAWISKALFKTSRNGAAEFDLSRVDRLWWYPPQPSLTVNQVPSVNRYFAHPLLVWMPRKMWRIQLRCPRNECNQRELTSAGIYQRVRPVFDITGWYNLAAEYLECPVCHGKLISWSQEILDQLDVGHRSQFPCILTRKLACDIRVIRMLRQRGLGNSSTQIQKKLSEQHHEVWLQKVAQYLTDCKCFRDAASSGLLATQQFTSQPDLTPVPKPAWFLGVYVRDVLQRIEQIKATITSTFGTVLKIDSTKKVTKKLAGYAAGTAVWATNVGNEHGQVVMSVLTSSEGYGLGPMVEGLVERYREAKVQPPKILYVDRDCCGESTLKTMVSTWQDLHIRLDIWHFMRRISTGCTTESHPLHGVFMARLSHCIFEWSSDDINLLKLAKRAEMISSNIPDPSDNDVLQSLTKKELSLHCRRTTRGEETTIQLISDLLNVFYTEAGCDTLGVPLVDEAKMRNIWTSQQKHVRCIQDIADFQLYTQNGTITKGGIVLPIFRCARGSVSLESFHLHMNRFIPGTAASDVNFQAYLVEGLYRWNIDRAGSAINQGQQQPAQSYSGFLCHAVNSLGEAVIGQVIDTSYVQPRKYTGEAIGIEYLFKQTGQVLQDYSKDAEQTPEASVDEDDDEGFVETDDYQDPTLSSFNVPELSLVSSVQRPEPQPKSHPQPQPKLEPQPLLRIPSKEDYQSLLPISVDPTDDSVVDPPDTHVKHEDDPTTVGPHNIPGYDRVLSLAKYLVDLRDCLSITNPQADRIILMWKDLPEFDRQATRFKSRTKSRLVTGRFKSSKSASLAPGVDSTRRCFLGSNAGPATWPNCNRYVEAVFILLCEIFPEPKRMKNKPTVKRFSLVQRAYSRIRTVVLDNARVLEDSNIQLPEVNQATLTQWYHRREENKEKTVLSQGLEMPNPPMESSQAFLPAGNQIVESGETFDPHIYKSPPNTAGKAKTRKSVASASTIKPTEPTESTDAKPTTIAEPTTTTVETSIRPKDSTTVPVQLAPAPIVFPPPLCSSTIYVMNPQGILTPLFSDQNSMRYVSSPSSTKTVAYSTLKQRKRIAANYPEGYQTRKYERKSNIIHCQKCKEDRSNSKHHLYFGNLYCQNTMTVSYQDWKEELKQKGYGKKVKK